MVVPAAMMGVVFLIALISCLTQRDAAERILFTKVSTSAAYSGVASTVSASGGKLRDVLSLGRGAACETVSANALDSPVIALVWQFVPAQKKSPHLCECSFGASECRRIFPNAHSLEGSGFISPDNRRLVGMAPTDHPQQYSLWLATLGSEQPYQLTEPANGSWDISPAWNPDGKELVFIRVRRSRDDGRLHTSLMKLNIETRSESQVLGEAEGVGVAAYSFDGKDIVFWSKNGLEVLRLDNLNRTVVKPTSSLPGFQFYSAGGLAWSAWSATSKSFAIPFLNRPIGMYQLVVISPDGSNVKTIYSSREFRMLGVSFVRQKM